MKSDLYRPKIFFGVQFLGPLRAAEHRGIESRLSWHGFRLIRESSRVKYMYEKQRRTSNNKFLSLKLLGQSGLLQNCIGSVPRFDMIVDDKADIGDRTVPDLVIAFSLPFELAVSFAQMLLQGSGVISH